MYQHIYFRLFGMAIFIFISCVFHHDFSSYEDKLTYMWDHHKKLVSQIFHYQTQGTIVYTDNSQRKMYVRFVLIHNNDYCCIKLFNVFGLTIISVSVKNGIVCISNGTMHQNNNLKNEIQKWLTDTSYVLEHLQQWILGLPNSNAEYNLNSIGCLSHINYCYNNKNISIYYRKYYLNNIPILPKILEIYYNQYYIKLIIDNWSIYDS